MRYGPRSTIECMDRSPLGPLGRRVMEHLWRIGPATVADVRGTLNEGASQPLAYTTVMTILVRLEERGYASRVREGRTYRYAAAFPEEAFAAELGRRELRRLLDRHGAATLAGFAADLAGRDSELVTRLRELADSSPEK